MPFVSPGDVQMAPGLFPSGAPNNNLSTVGGGVAAQPVVSSLYDYDPFSIMRLLFERHGQPPTFLQMLDAMGPDFNRGVSAPTTGHYEKDWIESLVGIQAIISGGGAGVDVIVSLTAASMYNPSITVGGVAAQASYPRVGQMIYFPDGKKAYIKAKNTTVNPHRLTLSPLAVTVDIQPSITAGNSYFISDNAYAEGSGLPPGVLPRVYKWTNTFQIAKEACASTGSELTNQTFVQFKQNVDGSVFMEIEMDMMKRFDLARSGALLWGQQISNVTDTGTQVGYDVPVRGTQGFINWVSTSANTDTYTVGSYTTADFYVIANIFEQQATGAQEAISWDGYGIWIAREQALQAFFANNIAPAMFQGMMSKADITFPDWDPANAKDFMAWLGFMGAHIGGISFYFKKLNEFSKAVGAGASGYNATNWSIIAPLSNVTDRTTGRQRAYIGYEWKQLGPYSRKAVLAHFGGAGAAGNGGYTPVAVNEYDIYRCGMVSELAFHGACPNKVVYQIPG